MLSASSNLQPHTSVLSAAKELNKCHMGITSLRIMSKRHMFEHMYRGINREKVKPFYIIGLVSQRIFKYV